MWYLALKTFHFVAFVSWMAGLFYLPRLFVYHTEALLRRDDTGRAMARTFELMESRLANIINAPALVMTFASGTGLIVLNPVLMQQPWLWAKLAFLAVLVAFHFYMQRTMHELAEGVTRFTDHQLRWLNEVPTVVLVAVCTLAVFKGGTSVPVLAGVMAGLVLTLGLLIQLYAVVRKRNDARRLAAERA